MLYHKNLSNFTWFLIILVFLDVLIPVSSEAKDREDTVELGETGFTSPVLFKEIYKETSAHGMFGSVSQKINIQLVKFSYKSNLPKHEGSPIIRHVSFRKNLSLPIGTKIFVFSCYDEDSLRAASMVNFDYGLCIGYRSAGDIRDFKKDLNLNQPVVMSNDETIKAFGVRSYPALITVHNDEFEIQEGF